MTPPALPSACVDGLRTVELGAGDEPLLQRFFDANPAYFIAVGGQPAETCEAHEEIHGRPPAEFPYSRHGAIGYADARGDLAAMAVVTRDLFAERIWHIGLFIVASARHGSGDAQRLYGGIEAWARAHGAAWMRLGVVLGHARAERFWQGRGFVQVRTREGMRLGRLDRTVRVLVKPLDGGTLADYRALVARDRPEPAAQ